MKASAIVFAIVFFSLALINAIWIAAVNPVNVDFGSDWELYSVGVLLSLVVAISGTLGHAFVAIVLALRRINPFDRQLSSFGILSGGVLLLIILLTVFLDITDPLQIVPPFQILFYSTIFGAFSCAIVVLWKTIHRRRNAT